MATTEYELIVTLKQQLLKFLDELIETIPTEIAFVAFRVYIDNQANMVEIMNYIVQKLCPLQNLVKTRNEEFFLKNNILFENMSNDQLSQINHFRKMWTDTNFTSEDRETLWNWFTAFIHIANKYKALREKKDKSV